MDEGEQQASTTTRLQPQLLAYCPGCPKSETAWQHGELQDRRPCLTRSLTCSDLRSRTNSRQNKQQVCTGAAQPTSTRSRSLPAPLLDGFAPPTRKGDPWRRRPAVSSLPLFVETRSSWNYFQSISKLQTFIAYVKTHKNSMYFQRLSVERPQT
jgi:hypothetical protein